MKARRASPEGTGDLFAPATPASPLPLVKAAAPSPAVRLVRFDDTPRAARGKGATPSPRRTWRWGAQVDVLLEILRATFEARGLPAETAAGLAQAALLALADYGGGRDFYLPRAVMLKAAIRDQQIRREFNGRNIDELATRYRLTTRRIRTILKPAKSGRA